MTSIDRLVNLYHLLSQVLVFGVPGDVVELGCHRGRTSVLLRMVIDHYAPERRLLVYDSFQGMPAPGPHDKYLHEGQYAVTPESVAESFRRWDVAPPEIVAGWFADTLPDRLPERIAFAYLDSDFEDSVRTSLEHVYPRVASKGIICIDDYSDPNENHRAWKHLPGVKRACDAFFADKPEDLSVLTGKSRLAMAYVRKDVPAR